MSNKDSQRESTYSALKDMEEGSERFRDARLLFSHFCVFTTISGCAGLGPRKIAKDDKICRFHGAVTPFIVRLNPRVVDAELTYALVGDYYIHDIIYGEGMKKGTAEDIRLR